MTFHPEHAHPALVKAHLFNDPVVYSRRDGRGFLLDGVAVIDSSSDDRATGVVQQLLVSEPGLPLTDT